jgi:hypothetical protein
MKAKLLTMLSLVVILTLVVGPVLAISPTDSLAATTIIPAQPAATVESNAAPAVAAQSTKAVGPFVSDVIVPGSYDGDLRDIPQALLRGSAGSIPEEMPSFDAPASAKRIGPATGQADPVAQRDAGNGDMPNPLVTFPALNNQDNFALYAGRVNPPDTNGAVGPNHYIQMVNLVWAIYDKAGNRLFGPAKPSAVFAAAGTGTICDTNNNGDPIVVYDSSADRWLISQFAFSSATTPPFFECIAVSKGPNPVTDGWWTYVVRIDDNFPDYPKLSVWPDAYYYTARMFPSTVSPNFFLSAFALERSAMLAGRPMRYVRFDLPGIYDSPLASNWRGEAPPAGTPALIALADDVTDSVVTWQFHVDWDNPANSTLSPEYKVSVAPFVTACPTANRDCIPFSGSTPTTMLDALSPRLMFNLEYRRLGSTESIWANHTITESGRTVVRWYELRYDRAGSVITPTVYQQGTYVPTDDVWRWMGSLAADKDGNMAIGYSASSPSIDPQIRYTGRLATDTLGVLAQGEVTMTIGTGHPTNTNSRWGDYSAMTVDPVDDCTFWYTQEYYTTTTGIPGDTRPWTTSVGAFKYPTCTPLAATGTITGLVYDATSLAPIPRIPVDAFDAANNRAYAGATDAFGVYTMTVLPGTYAVSGGPFASIGYPVKGTVSGVAVTSSTTSNANIPLNGAPYAVLGARTYADTVVGNGNGYPEPGEKQIGVVTVLTNTGVTTATSVVATLTSLTPGFTVVTPTVNYPDIGAGGAVSNSSSFGISIDGGLACGTVGSFRQVVVTAQGTFTLPYTLKLGIPTAYTCTFPVPNLSVASTFYTETSGDGYLQPGEVVTLNVTLSNTGLTNIGLATNVAGQLAALTPGFTLTVNSAAYPNIAANGAGTNSTPFKFTIDPNLICGAGLDFGMAMTTTEGTYAGTFRLVTGQPAVVPTTVLYDNVEAGAGTWVTSTNIPGVGFAITTESSHSPTHSWTDSPGGNYPNGLDTSLTSPVYDFTTYDTVQVGFWTRYATEAGFDYGLVEWSKDGGTTWNVAAAYDGAQATWVQKTVDLSAGLAHQNNVRIRFHFTSDSGVIDNGWYVDDIQISGSQRGCVTGQIEAVQVAATPVNPIVNSLSVVTATVSDLVGTPAASVPVTFTTGAYYADLAGANETPPVATAATGHLDFSYDPATNQLTYSGSVSGLSGAITGAHIHRGVAGIAGPVAVSLSYSGTAFSGLTVLSASDEALLLNGGLYVNVHTGANPGGEIRGQVLDHNLTAMLSGANEVPPVTTSGTGALIFMFDPMTNRLMYHGSVSSLNSNVTAAHIHTGTTGTSGGVLYNLSYITTTNGAKFSGVVTVTQAQVNALLSEGLYVNVHTTSSPGGEVRGQIKVGWLGMTDSQGRAVTHYTQSAPGPVNIYAYSGAVYGQKQLTFLASARLAVAHLAPFANTLIGTAVTVTLDGAPILIDVKYGGSTGYLTVTATAHQVLIYPAGSATPAITGNVVLSPNLSYSAIAIGDGVNQPLGLLPLLDDTVPVSGFAKIRIGHLVPISSTITATLVDVRLQNGTPVITNVPYSLVSPYLTLPAGVYDLKITAPGGAPTLIDPWPITLNSNDILSAFATGDVINQPLGVFAWPSNQPGFFLLLTKFVYLPLIVR